MSLPPSWSNGQRISFSLHDLEGNVQGPEFHATQHSSSVPFAPRTRASTHTHTHHAHAHTHQPQTTQDMNIMENAFPIEASPPSIPKKRPCLVPIFAICGLACISLAGFFVVEVSNLPSTRRRTKTLPTLPERRAESKESVRFGMWDSNHVLTPLQVTVAVSLALGPEVLDDDIHTVMDGNSFFKITIQHANKAVSSFVNHESFVESANSAISSFGGSLVLTREATVFLPSSPSPLSLFPPGVPPKLKNQV